jgi:hypothetical protein
MDISGQVRGILRQSSSAVAAPAFAEETDPIRLLVRAIAHPDIEITLGPAVIPAFLRDNPPLLERNCVRPVYAAFSLACAMRIVPRVTRMERDYWRDALQRHVAALIPAGEKMLLARDTRPIHFLWQHWLLLLAKEHAGLTLPATLIKGLWRRGTAAVLRGAVAPFHAPTAAAGMEVFVYDDLCALHAAFNSAVMARDEDESMMAAVEKVVAWHVQNTQPDNTTQEPWALAAFAALDDTATFAPQQLHDATQRITNAIAPDNGILLGLLADAVVTQGG